MAALAVIALDAMAAIETGRVPGIDWRGRTKELLDRHLAAEQASESAIQIFTGQQPPADLLISITRGVRKLVEAAVESWTLTGALRLAETVAASLVFFSGGEGVASGHPVLAECDVSWRRSWLRRVPVVSISSSLVGADSLSDWDG